MRGCRRQFLLLAAVLLGGSAGGFGEPGPAGLTVATFNLENYLPVDRRVGKLFRSAYPKPETSKAAVRCVLREIDADIVALQEMGPEPYLRELQRDLRREGSDYPHAALGAGADPHRHVAVLSRVPLLRVRRHQDLSFEYFGLRVQVSRGVLEIDFADESGGFTLYVLHLKSGYTDRADDPRSLQFRTREAAAVRDLILRRFPDPAQARFLVAGDLNDTVDSAPIRRLLRRGPVLITRAVPSADSRGEVWTHYYDRQETYQRLDYLLVSPGLWPAVQAGTGRAFDGECAPLASDHRAVFLRLVSGR